MDRKAGQDFDLGEHAGDARAASEAIGRWLENRPAPPAIDNVLHEMRTVLERLQRAPLMRDDAQAMAVIDEMARCRDMEELAVAVERLDVRVGKLLGVASQGSERRRAARTLLRL